MPLIASESYGEGAITILEGLRSGGVDGGLGGSGLVEVGAGIGPRGEASLVLDRQADHVFWPMLFWTIII